MKELSPPCFLGHCPKVLDPEDGSGDLIIVGYGPLTPIDVGVTVSNGEGVIRISRDLVEKSLKVGEDPCRA
jgi:hypothetical protein